MRTLVLVLISLTGCGIPASKALIELEEDQRAEVCQAEAVEMTTQTVQCEVEGTTLEVTSEPVEVDDCVARFDLLVSSCEATLEDWYECNDAFEADPCLQLAEELPAACQAVFACYDLG